MKYSFDTERHIHKLDGKPLIGTTTALGIISKPLTYWASSKAVEMFGWINPKKNSREDVLKFAEIGLDTVRKFDNTHDYVKFLDKAYKNFNTYKEKKADEGTDRHALVEAYIKARIRGETPSEIHKDISSFVYWCNENVKEFLWSEGYCYSKELWVGGICDLGYIGNDGKMYVADIKSSGPYWEQFLQCGGYDIQINENGVLDENGNNNSPTIPRQFDGYTIFPLNEKFKEPFIRYDTDKMKSAFIHAVELYKAKNVYEDSI